MRALFNAVLVSAFLALVAGATPGCNCNHNPQVVCHNGVCVPVDMGTPALGSISIMPSDVTLDITNGGPPAMQAFTVTYHDPKGDRDVTFGSTFMLSDNTAGVMNNNTFTTGTAHGGDVILTAQYTPPGGTQQSAQATIHIRVKGTFTGPDCGGMGQPACPTFPGDGAPACGGTTPAPKIVYPPDGVLLPPNMSVISVMWTPFGSTGIKAFEVDFQNKTTDVRVVTTCATQTQDTTGAASGGCELQLTQAMWDFIAKSNRGLDPVQVTVRATADGTCATPSMNKVNISFAEQDLNGALFYWKSSITAGGVGGNIFAKSFGQPTVPETQITGVAGTNLANATCFGCHALSRDGSRMTVNFDDADSDDEYGDVVHTLMDVATKNSLDNQTMYGHFEPGFQAIAPDNKLYVGTNGDLRDNPQSNILWMFNAMSGAALMPPFVTFGPANSRPTMPDFAPDGKSLLFVLPSAVGSWDNGSRKDDDHVFGGSIYSAPYDAATQTFGMPTAVVTSTNGDNNYYPSYSPDAQFIIYNHVPMQPGGTTCSNPGSFGSCPNDSFSNPKARVWILSTKAGAMPLDAEKLNGSPASAPVDVSNSWPRWSPFVQMYRGSPLLWVTFSSTRDYGLRVLNHKAMFAQCYPADSLQDPGGAHRMAFPSGCQQPQIWMAAINLATAEVMGQGDPSYPAFWLPYQDITKHNHTAQWTQAVAGMPNDMGPCIPNGQDCTSNPTACCSQTCLATGVCGMPIP